MKTAIAYLSAGVILLQSLTACSSSSSNVYLGTMAGAEIGGTIGEAIGWLSTSRHDGPGKAMLGSIIGTVAGAVIGNQVATQAEESEKSQRRDRRRDRYEENVPDYQTEGGYDTSRGTNGGYAGGTSAHRDDNASYRIQSNAALQISQVSYQDEDGDGRFSRYETINVIYEVRNTSNRPLSVELSIGDSQHDSDIAFSPKQNALIQPGKAIRYKAKAFLKNRLSDGYANISVQAYSPDAGTAVQTLKIKTN